LKEVAERKHRIWLCGLNRHCMTLLLALPEFCEKYEKAIFFSIEDAVARIANTNQLDSAAIVTCSDDIPFVGM
jgi:hypothetical protein